VSILSQFPRASINHIQKHQETVLQETSSHASSQDGPRHVAPVVSTDISLGVYGTRNGSLRLLSHFGVIFENLKAIKEYQKKIDKILPPILSRPASGMRISRCPPDYTSRLTSSTSALRDCSNSNHLGEPTND